MTWVLKYWLICLSYSMAHMLVTPVLLGCASGKKQIQDVITNLRAIYAYHLHWTWQIQYNGRRELSLPYSDIRGTKQGHFVIALTSATHPFAYAPRSYV